MEGITENTYYRHTEFGGWPQESLVFTSALGNSHTRSQLETTEYNDGLH